MPDTKTGREKKGKNKRAQLRRHLAKQELESLDGDADDEPSVYVVDGDDLLADEVPDDE